MGASRWTYFTPYRPDAQEALDELRAAAFAADAVYYREGGVETPAALVASGRLDEEPAHSVLDVRRVVRCEEDLEEPGDVRVIEPAETAELFGTAQPVREAVERALRRAGDGWFPPVDRGSGCVAAVHDAGGRPVAWCFWGLTGD
ncbi:hypothetical protein [Streptomyces sp. NPDC058955]|uniref:hypothetical protein n=1 Tax=unclassified Streptomyces TaxID=2593676 RepID=UPI0036464774